MSEADAASDPDVPDGRARVLARVRAALGRATHGHEEVDAPGRAAVAARIAGPNQNTVPARGQLQQPQLGALFEQMVEASGATLTRIQGMDQLPGAVAAWMAEHEAGDRVVISPHNPAADLDWVGASLQRETRPVEAGDPVTVSTAAAGIAETGILAVLSGPENPVRSSFLPESQVIVVQNRDVVGTPEEFWQVMRERGAMPRTVNWITGPSRTGDIEMTMTQGAHGPVRVHVVIVDAPA